MVNELNRTDCRQRICSLLAAALLGTLFTVGLAPAQEGSRATENIWASTPEATPAATPAPAAPDFSTQIAKLEKAVEDLEKLLGSPRGLRARQPFERRLTDLEARLDKIDKRLNDLETRLRKLETRRP
ncbi:MAG TPA: hypothetical protein P5567_07940 [Kiritimatiellia bacterium]|nr:hypothetical protein [Kiritimatiellia bacterium]HSA17872.1 hypothetical protein [Kiritimatiellia bacterium]